MELVVGQEASLSIVPGAAVGGGRSLERLVKNIIAATSFATLLGAHSSCFNLCRLVLFLITRFMFDTSGEIENFNIY